jgi:predicted AAA+ superfamily ATPase
MVHNSSLLGFGIGMYERFVERRAEEALSDTPVVLIVGPRRAGKTTLVRKMGDARRTYITLDDQTTLDAARPTR